MLNIEIHVELPFNLLLNIFLMYIHQLVNNVNYKFCFKPNSIHNLHSNFLYNLEKKENNGQMIACTMKHIKFARSYKNLTHRSFIDFII